MTLSLHQAQWLVGFMRALPGAQRQHVEGHEETMNGSYLSGDGSYPPGEYSGQDWQDPEPWQDPDPWPGY